MASIEERVAMIEALVPELKDDTHECKLGIIRIEEKLHALIKEVSYVRGTFKLATAIFLAGLGLFVAKIRQWFLS